MKDEADAEEKFLEKCQNKEKERGERGRIQMDQL